MKLQYIKYITAFLWVALAVQSWGQVSFLPAQTFSTGGDNPQGIAIGDMNNDGKNDIVVANWNSDNITIFRNMGQGNFSVVGLLAAGDYPLFPKLADIDNNGTLDILFPNRNSVNIGIIKNLGNFSFAGITTFLVGTDPNRIDIADFNGDGKPDVVVADRNGSGTLTVLTNSGTGAFSSPRVYATGSEAIAVVAKDFNNDGKIDLLASNFTSNFMTVYTNTGNGLFSLAPNPVGNTSNAFGIGTGDFNGDGNVDFAVNNAFNSALQVFTGAGNALFNQSQAIGGASNNGADVNVGDFNADGKLDIVIADFANTRVALYAGNGNGTFAAVNYVISGIPCNGEAVGDLNGDGKPDMVVADWTSDIIRVYLNNTLSPNQLVRLESGFGTNGIALLSNTILGGTFNIYDADIFPSGKMIMIGFYNAAGIGRSNDIALVQVNANGTLDNTFDGDGIKTFGFEDIAGGEWNDVSPSVEIDKLTGKIYFSLLSIATSNGNRTTYVYRLNSSGAFDNSFNSVGYAYVQDMTGSDRGYTQFQSLTLDENRKPIISFGIQIDPNLLDSYNVKMLIDGSGRDNTFGSGGQTRFWTTGKWGLQGWDHCYNIKINPVNNKIYNFGYFLDRNGGGYEPGRFYITENNSLPALLNMSDCDHNCFETMNDIDFDGSKLITVGNLQGDDRYGGPYINRGRIGIVKYNSDLTQDNSFDGDGFKEYYIRGIDRGYGVHKAQDGNYIVGGMSKANAGDGWDFSLSKLKPNGDFDESFNGTGKMWIDLGGDDYCRKTIYQRPYVYMFGSKDGIPSVAKVRVENVGFTGSTSICQGQSTTLTASGGNAYTWQPGNFSGSVQTLSPSVTTTYTVTGCIGTLCGASMVTVSVTAYPTLTITTNPSPLPNFAGMPFTVSGTGASTYDWRYNGTTFVGQNFTTNFSGARNITLIGTNLAGCTTTLSAVLATTSSLNFGLIASYPFSGNALDASGNNYHGSTFGGVSLATDRFGQTNKAMSFNGTDGYVDIPNTENLHLQTEQTLAVWVKSNDTDGFLVGKHFAGEVAGFFNHIGGYSGVENKYNYYISGNWLNLPTIVNDNNWHFLVASYSNGTLKAYVDGASVGTTNYNYTTTNTRTIKIGGGPTLSYLNGTLDDIRVYNRELILSEIQALYNEGLTTTSATLSGSNTISTAGGSIVLTSAFSPFNANTNTLLGWNTTLNGIASFDTITGILTALQSGNGVVSIQSFYGTVTSNIIVVSITENISYPSTPTAQSIPYFQDFESFTGLEVAYPTVSGIQGFRPSFGFFEGINTYEIASNFSSIDRQLNAPLDYNNISTSPNLSINLQIITTPGFKSISTSLFRRNIGFILALNTIGKTDMRLNFNAIQLLLPTTSGIIGNLVVEYRTNTISSFTSISGTNYNTLLKSFGQIQSFTGIILPVALDNQPYIQLRFLFFPNTLLGSNDFMSIGIDNISVYEAITPVTSVSISGLNSITTNGGQIQLTGNIFPVNATNPALVWSTSNVDIAILNQTGLVEGVTNGVVTITATSVSNPLINASQVITVSGQFLTSPIAQNIPYNQNFDSFTPVTAFAYLINSGIQGFSSQSYSGNITYSIANSGQLFNRSISKELDLSDLLLSNISTTSAIHLVTSSGLNKQFAVSLFNRSVGYINALNTTGKSNMVLNYSITQLEQESVSSIIGTVLFDYRLSTLSGFTTISGSIYSTASKTSGQVTNYTVTLPSAINNQPFVQLRFIAFPNSQVINYLSLLT